MNYNMKVSKPNWLGKIGFNKFRLFQRLKIIAI